MPTLSKYHLHEKLGEGATAEVYRALDTSLDREVALKLLKPSLVTDATAFLRFRQEARAAAVLFHPNIATVFEMGEADGRYFIAMRYIPGRSLARILTEDGPLSWDDTLKMATQMGTALDFAHSKGFLHRDVKPGNILRSEDGEYILTDFGLARAMMNTGLTSHTGAILGTPAYIAPEIWNGEEASTATDQYSLACVIYEMRTGSILFSGNTPAAIMGNHLLKDLQNPDLWTNNLPIGLKPSFLRALDKDPGIRYPTMQAFVADLSITNKIEEEISNQLGTNLLVSPDNIREHIEQSNPDALISATNQLSTNNELALPKQLTNQGSGKYKNTITPEKLSLRFSSNPIFRLVSGAMIGLVVGTLSGGVAGFLGGGITAIGDSLSVIGWLTSWLFAWVFTLIGSWVLVVLLSSNESVITAWRRIFFVILGGIVSAVLGIIALEATFFISNQVDESIFSVFQTVFRTFAGAVSGAISGVFIEWSLQTHNMTKRWKRLISLIIGWGIGGGIGHGVGFLTYTGLYKAAFSVNDIVAWGVLWAIAQAITSMIGGGVLMWQLIHSHKETSKHSKFLY